MRADQLLNIPEIRKRVYDKFPVSKAEKTCENEKREMNNLRVNFAKKLYDQMPKEKKEYGK